VRTSRDTGQDRRHVVARDLVDVLGELAQQRERLADATARAEHGHLGRLEPQAHARGSRERAKSGRHVHGSVFGDEVGVDE